MVKSEHAKNKRYKKQYVECFPF
ncbi:hypothetical protein F0230_11355 [Vibrio aestuarianus]|nr:hypothetical protein [Vibrio aestuarianus]